jgi:multidrug efflux system membrane fusion protein
MSSAPSPRRPWLLYGAVALVFAAGVWYFGIRTDPNAAGPGRMSFRSRSGSTATPVRVEPVLRRDLAVHLRAIGTVTPRNTVTVRSRVEGQLLKVHFQEGQQVAAGQLLAEIDPLPYEIRLAQAEARLRQNRAQLLTAKADLERVRQLHAQTLMSQQQLEAAQALVADREGAGAADQANVDDARRQLAYTRIEAPLSGRLGLRQVDAGNLIRPGDAGGIVVITQTRPINVLFTVPEQELPKVLEPLRAGQGLPVEAWDRAEQQRLAAGLLNTVDNQIDLATGTLRLKAEFPNEDEKLFPNQFVNVRLRVRTFKDAVVVPVAAVQYGSRGTYVYLVTEDSLAAVRDVVLGPAEAGMQAVLQGLSGGERVVLEGIDRLREGRPVTIVAADGTVTPPPAGKGEKSGKGERAGKGGKGEKADQGGKGGQGNKGGQGEKSDGARKKAA